MLAANHDRRIFLSLGVTDMRKAINGLSLMVSEEMEEELLSGDLFVFCNRGRNILKILYWDRNGFCLWQKRLEKHRFKWPGSEEDVLEIEERELSWLLDGLDIHDAHERLNYTAID